MQVVNDPANLVAMTVTMNPPAPSKRARHDLLGDEHGAEHRSGAGRLLQDALLPLAGCGEGVPATCSSTGTRSAPSLVAGASHSGTATVTIPSATPLDTLLPARLRR